MTKIARLDLPLDARDACPRTPRPHVRSAAAHVPPRAPATATGPRRTTRGPPCRAAISACHGISYNAIKHILDTVARADRARPAGGGGGRCAAVGRRTSVSVGTDREGGRGRGQEAREWRQAAAMAGEPPRLKTVYKPRAALERFYTGPARRLRSQLGLSSCASDDAQRVRCVCRRARAAREPGPARMCLRR